MDSKLIVSALEALDLMTHMVGDPIVNTYDALACTEGLVLPLRYLALRAAATIGRFAPPDLESLGRKYVPAFVKQLPRLKSLPCLTTCKDFYHILRRLRAEYVISVNRISGFVFIFKKINKGKKDDVEALLDSSNEDMDLI